MTAAVFGYKKLDASAFLAGTIDHADAEWVRIYEMDDEDSIFHLYVDGKIKEGPEFTGGSFHFHRTYYVDEKARECWTHNPDTGAVLSSGTWEFDTEGAVD